MKKIFQCILLLLLSVTISFSQGKFTDSEIWCDKFLGEFPGEDNDYFYNRFGDVNGDGKADALAVRNSGIYVRLSTGYSFLPEEQWSDANWVFDLADVNWKVDFADVNGDGKDDAVSFNHNVAYVRLSTGIGFASAERWLNEYGNGDELQGKYVEDVNGDGKADLIRVWFSGVYVALSTGTSFAGVTKWTQEQDPRWDWVDEVGDVTGDGKADMMSYLHFNDDLTVWIHKSFEDKYIFHYSDVWLESKFAPIYGLYDVTGDLKADLVLRLQKGGDERNRNGFIRRSNGKDFYSPSEIWTTDNEFIAVTSRRNFFADVTGDGKVDAMEVLDDKIVVRRAMDCNNSMQFNIIPDDPLIILRATNSISLLPGALVKYGNKFSAKAEPCSITTTTPPFATSARLAGEQKPEILQADLSTSSDIRTDDNLYVYPNPSNGMITIYLSNRASGNTRVKLFDSFSREVYSRDIYELKDEIHLDLSSIARGIYYIQVIDGDSKKIGRIVLN